MIRSLYVSVCQGTISEGQTVLQLEQTAEQSHRQDANGKKPAYQESQKDGDNLMCV